MPSTRGGKYGFVFASRHKAYGGIRRSGASKTKSAKIANAGRTKAARSAMARKGWRTRKRKRR